MILNFIVTFVVLSNFYFIIYVLSYNLLKVTLCSLFSNLLILTQCFINFIYRIIYFSDFGQILYLLFIFVLLISE